MYRYKNVWKYISFIFFSIFIVSVFIFFKTKSSYKKIINTRGKICLIIDDFGYSENNLTIDFLNLPKDFTISIIPGRKYSEDIAHMAVKYGFETIIHMPMESYNWNKVNEKKFMLTSELNYDEIDQIVKNAILEIPDAKGMNNHQGSKATEDSELMKNLARVLKKHNIYFVDSYTTKNTKAFITMRQMGVKSEIRQIFLDHIDNPDSIKKRLYELVKLSENMDVAIGIGHVKESTYNILFEEIPKIKKQGYQFLTTSKIVQ